VSHKAVQKEATKLVRALQEQYGLEALPENVQQTLKAIEVSDSPTGLADAAVRKMEMACLAAWARGEIAGPDTPESLERRAKQADNLARMFEKKEDHVGARKQQRRAEALRQQAAAATRSKETHNDDVK